QADNVFDNVLDLPRIDEIGGTARSRDSFFRRIGIDRDDPPGAGDPCALHGAEAYAARTEHHNAGTGRYFCTDQGRAEAGGDPAGDAAGVVRPGMLRYFYNAIGRDD